VGPDKLRFDFTHFEAVPGDALREVETNVNDVVSAAAPVTWEILPYDKAVAVGAMAFFGEKYGDAVRMVTVPGISRELCGGTHVRNTIEIGPFRIVSEGALAAGVRRIEALTGPAAVRHLRDEADRLHEISRDLKVSTADAADRVRKLFAQIRALEKDLQDARRRSSRDIAGEVLGKAVKAGAITLVPAEVESMEAAALRELADRVKAKLKSGILLLGSVQGGRCHLVAGVTEDLSAAYSANDIVKKAAAHVGGGGGGRRDMAQAGGSKVEGLPDALRSLSEWVK
jgi:alanyl-tRNA synthetase